MTRVEGRSTGRRGVSGRQSGATRHRERVKRKKRGEERVDAGATRFALSVLSLRRLMRLSCKDGCKMKEG